VQPPLLGSGQEELGSVEHLGSRAGTRRTDIRVRLGVQQRRHHLVISLKDRTGQRTLRAVVGAVGIGAQGNERSNRVGVPVVGSQHQQGVARRVGEVRRDPVLDIRQQSPGVTCPRKVEARVGDRDQPESGWVSTLSSQGLSSLMLLRL